MASKLRHIAIIVEDPEASAKFFEEAFDMKRAGTARRGIYMSDGIFNVALLKKEGDEGELGLYHFGMWVDDLDEAEKKVVDAGGEYLAGRPTSAKSFYEAKYKSPDRPGVRPHPHRLGRRREGRRAGEGTRAGEVTAAAGMAKPDPVIVVGAGPVGLCLALALAQQDVAVVLIEALSDDNFLDQVPRAGSNHPTTLEFFDRIGLYAKMEPRGLIAPKFQYWDRQDNALIAEFDHALLKDDTRFPYVLQCERIKIIEEALKMAKAHPLIEVRMATEFTGFEQTADAVLAQVQAPGGNETIRGSYLVSAEGARSVARQATSTSSSRASPIRSARSTSRSPTTSSSTATPSATTSPTRSSIPTCSTGRARRTAGASISRPRSTTTRTKLTRPEAMQARLKNFLGHRPRFRRSAAATSTPCTSAWRRSSARAACCSPATPPTSTARSAAWD